MYLREVSIEKSKKLISVGRIRLYFSFWLNLVSNCSLTQGETNIDPE